MKSKYPYPLALVVIAIVSHIHWFNPASVLTYSDWFFWPQQAVSELWLAAGSWMTFWNMGGANIQIPFLGFMSVWSLFTNLGFSYDLATKVTFFIPIAILGFIAPYLFIKKLTANDLTAFSAALFYGTTTYFLVRQTAHLPIAMIYVLTPLLLLLFIRALENRTTKSWVYFGLLYSLGIIYEVRIMLIITVALLLYFIIFTSWRQYLSTLWSARAAIIIVIGLSLFWLIPTVFSGAADVSEVADRGLFGNNLFDLAHALTLYDPSWTGTLPDQNFIKQPVPWYHWVIPILSFSAFLFYKKFSTHEHKLLIFFALLALIGVFLSKQADEPLEGAYSWLYHNLPIFSLYREASKFYLLTALGYTGLLSLFLIGLYRLQRLSFYLAAAAIIVLSFINLRPLMMNEMGTLFVQRNMPQDYATLESFISSQPDFFRTYWLPRDSRWAPYSANHPKVSGIEMIQSDWQPLTTQLSYSNDQSQRDQIVSIFEHAYSENILTSASVKYVVVPLHDHQNDDNFYTYYGNSQQFYIDALNKADYLKRINIGTKDLVVYENKSFKPHINGQADLVKLDNLNNLTNEYNFLNTLGVGNSAFYTNHAAAPLTSPSLKSIFSEPQTNQKSNSLVVTDQLDIQGTTNSRLYKNTAASTLSYQASTTNLKILSKKHADLSLDNKEVGFNNSSAVEIIDTIPLKPDQKYYLLIGDEVLPIRIGEFVDIGRTDNYTQAELHTNGKNLITNPSFEDRLWDQKVSDCNNYDDKQIIGMIQDKDNSTDGKYSLQLEAVRHIACTGKKIQLQNTGSHVLSFDYQSPNAEYSGYYLQFNDKAKTTISDKLLIQRKNEWQTVTDTINVPFGATKANLVVYAYESDGSTKNVVRYDNFNFYKTDSLKSIKLPSSQAQFEPLRTALEPGIHKFELNADTAGENIIKNPSFEMGAWNDHVSNCGNYDNKPIIGMRLNTNEKTDGLQSLQLEATRHTACTSLEDITINSAGDHMLSFNTQGLNSSKAGFNLQFNDSKKSTITEQLKLNDDEKWQTFSKKVKVPLGATSATLTIYAYESDSKTNNIVRYDNFELIKIPDLDNVFYLLTDADSKLIAPTQINYGSINPTQKFASIKNSTTPFLFSFSESYHYGWKLYLKPLNKARSCETLHTYSPPTHDRGSKVSECRSKLSFMTKDDIHYLRQRPLADDTHIKINGYANGWIIDPAFVKANFSKEYYQENPDGSINMDLVVYFKPQSYFYIGLAISGVTLAICIVYLVWSTTRRKNHKNYSIHPDAKSSRHSNQKIA